MTKRFTNPKGKILVAINLDDASVPVLKAAGAIARRTGLGLSVLHVNEYWVGRTWPAEMMLGGPMGGLVGAVEEETLQVAQDRLRQMVQSTLGGMKVEEEVILGYPVEAIRAHAVTIGAELIVLGGVTSEYKFVPRGLSTVLGLLGEAPCPVLALPRDHPGNWEQTRLKVLLSDDLSAQTEGTVIVGYEIATALGQVDLIHTHVNQMTKEDLKTALATAAAAAHAPQGALTVDSVWTAALKSIETTLSERAPGRKHLLEARGGTLKQPVLHGSPTDEILALAQREKADLLIFGRHRTWRRKPFAVGQMPFHSMLKSGKPVLVADH